MGTFLVFTFKSGLVLTALYLVYRLFLSRTKQPTFNRVVLLLIYLISALCVAAFEYCSDNTFTDITGLTATLGDSRYAGAAEAPAANTTVTTALLYVWIAGMAATSVAIGVSALRLRRTIRKCDVHKVGGIRVAVSDNDNIAPFSTARTIVLARKDIDASCPLVIRHELQHIRLWHWADLAIGHIIAVVAWYNPVSWLMIGELKEVHEFQVDNKVLSMGVNAREYQYMLLQKTLGRSVSVFANSLSYGSIRRRIAMMSGKDTPRCRRWLLAVMVPAAAIAVYAGRVPALNSFCDTLSRTSLAATDAENAAGSPAYGAGAGSHIQSQRPRPAGTIATPFYYINGHAYVRLPNDFDENDIESVSVRRDIPAYPDGVYYITTKSKR